MSLPVSIENALADATERLRSVSDSARLDAELLLARAIDMPRSYLFAHSEDTLDQAACARLDKSLSRRAAGEPIAYIMGAKEFWSMEFMVSPATLVPRPETELLVDVALRAIPRKAALSILDLGTGSGAIALAIAKDRPLCHVTAIDISADALAVAAINATQFAVSNVEFLEGDWSEPVVGRHFDVIVSNPPYVALHDPALDSLGSEPAIALTSGDDGLDAIRTLARDCPSVVNDGAQIVLEHGAGQRDAVTEILIARGWDSIRCYDDYAGHPRVTSAHFYRAREHDHN